jgi:signal transduction histidine kinase/CheY-like chemotaxis protein
MSQQQLLGKHPKDISGLGVLNSPEVMQAHFAQREAGMVFRDFEFQVQTNAGLAVWMMVSGRPYFDPQGHFAGYRGVGSLIDARKKMEAERADLAQALQQRNTELDQARILAEKGNRAKSDFLSHMSHELRTPLNAILGFSQILESDEPPPTPHQQKSLDQITKAGWYLLSLIDEILDLARVESGRVAMKIAPCGLAEMLRDCEILLGPQTQTNNIQLKFHRPEGDVQVLADPIRLKQIFINLISNAIKYNRVGGVVTVQCTPRPKGVMRVSVQDTGAGLSPDEITQLFQPFVRLATTARKQEGSGIGLAMCKRLVELMGGVIGVESTVGQGSIFWIELSLSTSPRIVAATEMMAPTPRDKASYSLLYVEDNPANLQMVQVVMERHPGIRFLSAEDARSGLEIARAEQPDIILMDINLPGMSGLEALKILRADARTAHIPVLALSASAMPDDIETGLQAGFFDYLTKPVKVDELMAKLDAALKHLRPPM